MNEFSENNLIEQTAVNINSFDFLLPKLGIIRKSTGIPSLRAQRSNPGGSLQFVRQVSPVRIHSFDESQASARKDIHARNHVSHDATNP